MSAAPAGKPAGLSVFFPAYNDSGTIASMVIRAVRAAAELTPDFEVIVVDDGSADATPEIVDELARTYAQVRAVHHPKNRGYGGALQTGFRSATKELIFYTDGDAQYDPAELKALWERMTPEADLRFSDDSFTAAFVEVQYDSELGSCRFSSPIAIEPPRESRRQSPDN